MSSHSISLAATICFFAASTAEAGVYSLGHGDLRIRFEDGQLVQSIHLDAESIMDDIEAGNAPHGVDYVPEDTTILVPEPTLPRPDGAEWDFIATAAGNPVWYIPEVQEFDRPWFGYSTESLERNEWTNFRMSLLGMTAPFGGHFSLIDSGGPLFARTFLATGDGITAADSYDAPLQAHAHYSWLFTQPGDYYLTLQISGTHETAGTLSSTAVYHFAVVPEPSGSLLLLLSASAAFLRRSRKGSAPPSPSRANFSIKAFATALALAAMCPSVEAQTSSGAEQRWESLSEASRAYDAVPKNGAREDIKKAAAAVTRSAADFIIAHPGDSRVKQAAKRFWKAFDDGPPSAETALALLKALPDATRDDKESLELVALAPRRAEIARQASKDRSTAAQAERDLISEYAAKYPGGRIEYVLVANHLSSVELFGFEELEKTARQLSDCKREEIRKKASLWLKTQELKRVPVDVSFTAIDGREVNFEKLRGKVVLLEFTGVTWCPACRKSEELLKELYHKYHDRGLEVVAITYEFEPASREKVVKLINERQLAWPFFFDGLAEKNPHIQRFGINAFPTVFLFEKTGKLHASHVKDEALEPMIAKLLGAAGSDQPSEAIPPPR